MKPVVCSFHLTQSFYRNIKKIGLAPQYRKDKETRKICRQILSLHLLPAEKIVKQFQNIKDGASGLMLKFCCYVEENYIKSTLWTPSNWSMHGQHIRTNNHVGGTHNKLKAVVGKIRITEIKKKNFKNLPYFRTCFNKHCKIFNSNERRSRQNCYDG